MVDKPLTIWESAQLQGYSRRDFLRFCGWLAAAAGIEASAIGQVVKAMDTKPRLPVVWFHFQECTCCSESFIRSSHPIVGDVVLDKISLDYTETLQAAAGKQAEEALHATMTKYKGEYLMLVEGSVPTADGGKVLINDTDHSYFWIELKADGVAFMTSYGNQYLGDAAFAPVMTDGLE